MQIPKLNLGEWLSLLVFFLWPALAVLTGLSGIELGARAFGPTPWSSFFVQFLGLAIGVFAILIWPISVSLWDERQNYSLVFRFFGSVLLLTLPLCGYSFYLTGAHRVEEWIEITTTVIPSVILATLLYHRTKNVIVWALSLTLFFFFSAFAINEILGPYLTYFSLTARVNSFIYLRTAFPLFSILGLSFSGNAVNLRLKAQY